MMLRGKPLKVNSTKHRRLAINFLLWMSYKKIFIKYLFFSNYFYVELYHQKTIIFSLKIKNQQRYG